MKITDHAKKRLKERYGINAKASERLVEKVLENGVSHKDTHGQLNRWITKQYLSYGVANNIKLYGDKAFLFSGDVLITVIPIPNRLLNQFHGIKDKLEKEEADEQECERSPLEPIK